MRSIYKRRTPQFGGADLAGRSSPLALWQFIPISKSLNTIEL